MGEKDQSRWQALRGTLWFLPAAMTIAAVVLAFGMIELDTRLDDRLELHTWWLFEGGAEGARGVLSTIAGTMITVAATAFSITIVAMQLGSSQFTSRILQEFSHDRRNQYVLGIFFATFAYAEVVLRSVRSEAADGTEFVPAIAVGVAILLAFTAVGSLVFYFHHATRSIQAPVVIDHVADDTFALIERRLAQEEAPGWIRVENAAVELDSVAIAAGRSGHITAIDLPELVQLARQHDLVLTVAPQMGAYMLSISALVYLPESSFRRLDSDTQAAVAQSIREAFDIEFERTLEHDLLLGFRQLVDIAVKALSSGANDPTTAEACINSLAEATVRVRHLHRATWQSSGEAGGGMVRVTSVGIEEILDEWIPHIRHYGASDVLVMEHLLFVLKEIADVSGSDTAMLLRNHALRILDESGQTLTVGADQELLRAAAAWALPNPA